MTKRVLRTGLAAAGVTLLSPMLVAQPSAGANEALNAFCAVRQADGTGLRLVPGALQQAIVFARPAGAHVPRNGDVEVTVQPGGARLSARARVNRDGGRADGVAIHPRGADLVRALGNDATVQVVRGGQVVAQAHFDGTVMAAMNACVDRRLRLWGMDVGARTALRSLPQLVPTGRELLTSADYPNSLAARRGGASVLRFTIGTDGRITACEVAQSSGAADLDAAGCWGWQHRARYSPAIGSDGRPVAAQLIQLVEWRPYRRAS